MSITRRQHYVWRHHLSAWERDGHISVVRRGGSSFVASPINVAVERDFYRLPYLGADDEAFVQSFIEAMDNDMLRNLAKGWLDTLAAPSRLRRAMTRNGVSAVEVDALLADLEIQLEESFHSGVEGDSVVLLDKLRSGRSDCWSETDFARDFSFFIALQYFRTKRMREALITAFNSNPMQDRVRRTFPIFRLIFASNVGWSIFPERKNWRLRLLETKGNTNFVTSDQPVVNLLTAVDHNDLALFYPISPTKAALLQPTTKECMVPNGNNLSEQVISELNKKIAEQCHEQLFGNNLDYLKSLSAANL